MKTITILIAAGLALASTGCRSINNTPVIGAFVPDLTNPVELEDTAEVIAAAVCENNPSKADNVLRAALDAEAALSGEIITRAQFDQWVDELLARNIKSAALRVFLRQRFDRAWAANAPSLDVSGLVLKKPEHMALAKAFIAGLRKGAQAAQG